MCSVAGQPPPGRPGAVGGVRRPDGVPVRQLGRRELPPAAEAAGLLPAAAHTQRKEQRGRPGKGELPNRSFTQRRRLKAAVTENRDALMNQSRCVFGLRVKAPSCYSLTV